MDVQTIIEMAERCPERLHVLIENIIKVALNADDSESGVTVDQDELDYIVQRAIEITP